MSDEQRDFEVAIRACGLRTYQAQAARAEAEAERARHEAEEARLRVEAVRLQVAHLAKQLSTGGDFGLDGALS